MLLQGLRVCRALSHQKGLEMKLQPHLKVYCLISHILVWRARREKADERRDALAQNRRLRWYTGEPGSSES